MRKTNFRVTEDLYASAGNRFANYIVDRIITTLLMYAFFILIGALLIVISDDLEGVANTFENVNPILDYLLSYLVLILIYFSLEVLLKGRTIGKYITNTVVVNEFGERPTVNQILIRSACRFIPFNPFSFLGATARGWHDEISKTYVVDVTMLKRRKEIGNELDQIGNRDELIV